MGLFDFLKQEEDHDGMYLYTEKELNQYETYIQEQFGAYDEVLHELLSSDIHLDVLVIPPTKEANYYKLVTMGMGAYSMNVPSELREFELERAEFILYLPPTWDIHSVKEEDYWPIRYLKIMARLPLQCNTWFGVGHTISSNKQNEPFDASTDFCSMMLFNGTNIKYEPLDFRFKDGKKVNFYHLFPLYLEELLYKQKYGFDVLMDLFPDEDLIPIVNLERKNYGKDLEEKNN